FRFVISDWNHGEHRKAPTGCKEHGGRWKAASDCPAPVRPLVESAGSACDRAVGPRGNSGWMPHGLWIVHTDYPIGIGWSRSRFERLHDDIRLPGLRPHAGLAVDRDHFHPLRHPKIDDPRAFERIRHEVLENGRCKPAAGG